MSTLADAVAEAMRSNSPIEWPWIPLYAIADGFTFCLFNQETLQKILCPGLGPGSGYLSSGSWADTTAAKLNAEYWEKR